MNGFAAYLPHPAQIRVPRSSRWSLRMRILVATDAVPPQVNGVVRTYERLASQLCQHSVEMVFLVPDDFRTFSLPTYPEIRLALPDLKRVHERIDELAPDFIHVATEGPVGWMTRSVCLARSRPFTTSYHTRFPEYAAAILGLPANWCYGPARYFHNAGVGTMVATPSLAHELVPAGFQSAAALDAWCGYRSFLSTRCPPVRA